ncbi:GNAT family N-acetyltransferase [Paenibacillus sp. JX-17]|uniref:GNAT family N-acetyltransferase n=1 Tax=Paenibacillus lacisoli TaxID=3064525 RepID=A0ABT9CCL4_9BACL|nr:GNAT family N-acetyltransferase [Paenibacillus sp. JX-17]MDO7907005.1 GNAT family N-acetyltransferase [Paenibacillus sp. JX-17]
MKILPLSEYPEKQLMQLGSFGYQSRLKFAVTKQESAKSVHLSLELVELEKPYIKLEPIGYEDHARYREMVEEGNSFGLYMDEELAGIAVCGFQAWNNTLVLWHLQVAERHRRKSLGSLLISSVEQAAKSKGIRAITAETQNTNTGAIAFYRSCGFKLEGIDLSLYTNEDAVDGEVALYMKKKLYFR